MLFEFVEKKEDKKIISVDKKKDVKKKRKKENLKKLKEKIF